jgi:hypothetical protein
LFFAPPPQPKASVRAPRAAKERVRIDPQTVAKVRELRDRCLERVNSDQRFVLQRASGKYDMSRVLESRTPPLPLLAAG